ncbi:putative HTH-type transcriptional regulator YbdO [compost metagenome]
MDLSRFDLNLLVSLDTLLAELNVTKAASRLHISPPAMSAKLSRLRELMGDPLKWHSLSALSAMINI